MDEDRQFYKSAYFYQKSIVFIQGGMYDEDNNYNR